MNLLKSIASCLWDLQISRICMRKVFVRKCEISSCNIPTSSCLFLGICCIRHMVHCSWICIASNKHRMDSLKLNLHFGRKQIIPYKNVFEAETEGI